VHFEAHVAHSFLGEESLLICQGDMNHRVPYLICLFMFVYIYIYVVLDAHFETHVTRRLRIEVPRLILARGTTHSHA